MRWIVEKNNHKKLNSVEIFTIFSKGEMALRKKGEPLPG